MGPARPHTSSTGWAASGSGRRSNNDRVSCALDDGKQLRALLLRYLKLVERLVEVVDEGVNDRGDVVNAAEPLIERGWLCSHVCLLELRSDSFPIRRS